MNLAHECIEVNAGRIPNRTAIIDADPAKRTSYKELNQKVNSLANALVDLGIQKGDRVALYLPNGSQFLTIFLSICKIGAISVPMNVMFKQTEIEYIVNNSGAKAIFSSARVGEENILPCLEKLDSIENIVFVDASYTDHKQRVLHMEELIDNFPSVFNSLDLTPDDPVSLLYTSGTTGKPKGALASHENWLSMTRLSAYQIVPMTDEDMVLIGYPFFHVAIVIGVLPVLLAGGTIIAANRFYPRQTLELIQKYKISHFMGTPTMWTYLVNEYIDSSNEYDLSSLVLGQSAGATLPGETAKKIEEVFNLSLIECYGATECSSTVTHTRYRHPIPGSVGWPTPGWEIAIKDESGDLCSPGQIGELWCKGPGVIKKYWNDPKMSAEKLVDGWWRSGDLAFQESASGTEGVLHIVERKDDTVICGGYNIYPSEVENCLASHPKVLQAIVVGIPDEIKGQIPKAFVVLQAGEKSSQGEIIGYCKEKMAAYKAPRVVEFVELNDLPQSATGKILKNKIRDQEKKRLSSTHS